MIIQHAEYVVCYDVDGTLVSEAPAIGAPNTIPITNPYSGITLHYTFNERHIELLRAHHGRGMYVKVWSAAGYKWAASVVNELGLNDYVDAIETKPALLVDDLEVHQIFPARVFLKDE